MYTIEEFDKAKTKVLKYIMYKKRTEQEIKVKFRQTIEENLLEDVIEELKNIGYINDENYIERAINENMALKNLSIKELKYKLMAKGVKASVLEEYMTKHEEELEEYEQKSADNIVIKKITNMEEREIEQYLRKKGYKEEAVKNALAKREE